MSIIVGLSKLRLKLYKNRLWKRWNSQFSLETNKFNVPPRYARQKESIWNSYIQLALDYRPLSLGPGYPDYGPPDFVVKALSDVVNGDNLNLHQYTRGYGHPRLVRALSQLYGGLIKRKIDPMSNILVTAGAYEALYSAIHGHVQDGDEVIIIEPFFDSYAPLVESAGGICKYVELKSDTQTTASSYKYDLTAMENAFSPKTKMIILNNPNSHLGKVYSQNELEHIAMLCKNYNTICLADEVYEWTVFPGLNHIRMSSLPDMWDRTITIGSAGKAFNITGWRLGWVYGPLHLLKNLQLIHQYCIYTCSTPLQEALAISIETEIARFGENGSYFATLPKALMKKSEYLKGILEDVSILPVLPQAGVFLLADYTNFIKKENVNMRFETDEQQDVKFTKWMIKNIGILTIPSSYFYSLNNKKDHENLIRVCFFKKEINLKRASDLIINWKKTQLNSSSS